MFVSAYYPVSCSLMLIVFLSMNLCSTVTALDSSNTEGALLPVPMVLDPVDGKSGTEPVSRNGTDICY